MGWENLLFGFEIALQPHNLAVAVLGITLGTVIGVLPGLGGANGVAILLPLTFSMHPTSAIILLTSLYWGALFGGAITSILFNIPGEPWSVATTFDGYPMAREGRGGEALAAAFTSSFVGALFAVVLITLFAPLLAEVALQFGPPEFFSIQLLTFSAFIGLGGGNPIKSLVSILIGFILASAGLDIITGQLRLTFGITELMKGFDFIVAVIGLFGIGEILLSVEEGLSFRGVSARINPRVVWQTWKTLPRYYRTFVRGAFIGFWMGFKPGGATPASFMSYAFAKRFSRHPERFGKGEIEGVIAPETAAHAPIANQRKDVPGTIYVCQIGFMDHPGKMDSIRQTVPARRVLESASELTASGVDQSELRNAIRDSPEEGIKTLVTLVRGSTNHATQREEAHVRVRIRQPVPSDDIAIYGAGTELVETNAIPDHGWRLAAKAGAHQVAGGGMTVGNHEIRVPKPPFRVTTEPAPNLEAINVDDDAGANRSRGRTSDAGQVDVRGAYEGWPSLLHVAKRLRNVRCLPDIRHAARVPIHGER